MTLPGRRPRPVTADAYFTLPADHLETRFPHADWQGLRQAIAARFARLVPSPAGLGPGTASFAMEAIEPSLHLPVAGHRPSPVPASNDSAGDRSPDRFEDSAGEPIEAEHAEVWELVRAAQGGDGEAFGRLYDRYVDSVFKFVYYRVNDRQLAEDFTSETFLRALRRISTINYQGRDIGAWFMTIARNIVFDHSKSARFRLEMTTGEVIEGDDRADSPEAAVLAHLTNERLLMAVNSLNDEQKECIVLRFLNGLSVAETAEIMDKNDGAIKALQHRAVKRLSALVAEELR
ncbi:sigma-70 family RNA polymerase sigma factor [Jatrophihabitans telluris]|uniref:Sigma-70 family RNA polymerase sigma factor n=1 Tax=Jatrophihabitans telluris TaxID=2038343 RepID=A0ABY4QZC6_9ACTN|nr:sigma-70 family RNA polymerase sigma factor [Jatrophihabitans telluris]UQX88868.1 sigma-70 family RNA polymerase sigma factor [Jatrophihabitans telluris]